MIWLTWFLRILLPFLALSLLLAIITKIEMNPRVRDDASLEKKAVFKQAQFFVVFSILFVYSLQSSMFCILLGQIFSKRKPPPSPLPTLPPS